MTFSIKNVSVVDNVVFGCVLSNEHGRWNTQEHRPFITDVLHLGKTGIRVLAMNFKISILGKRKPQSPVTFIQLYIP